MIRGAETQVERTACPPVPSRLGIQVLVGWACGSFATTVLISSVGLLHLRYMTDSLGIGAAVAGSLVVISRFGDGMTDPVMGFITDRTRDRWGPKPFLLAGTVLCAASMYALFHPPAATGGALLPFMVFALLLFSIGHTVFRIPYLAMAAEMSRGFEERAKLTLYNVLGGSLGTLAATTLAPFLLAYWGSNRRAHALVSTALAGMILVSGLICFATMRSVAAPVARTHQSFGIKAYFAAVRLNRPFLALIGYKAILYVALVLHLAATPYFLRHVLRISDRWLGSLFLVQTALILVSQPLWRPIARHYGHRATAVVSTVMFMIAMTAWLILPYLPRPDIGVIVIGALQGLAAGGFSFSIQTMLPDTMEYDWHLTGERREGLLAGMFVMVDKISTALAVAIYGYLMAASGYVASQDSGLAQLHSAIRGIYLAASVLPTTLGIAACVLLRGYHLSEAELRVVGLRDSARGAPELLGPHE